MTDTVFEVRVPRALLQLGIDQHEVEHRLNEWLVLSLFTGGHISSGKAARLLNIHRIEFLALLRTHGIAYVNYTPDELADELAAVDALAKTTNT
jgi:predicted HTH domain antitoxin